MWSVRRGRYVPRPRVDGVRCGIGVRLKARDNQGLGKCFSIGHQPQAWAGERQKSRLTLNLANRAEVIDNGFRYVATVLIAVGE